MERSQTDRLSRGGFAAVTLLIAALSLGGCATAPPGETQLSWPVGNTYTVRSGDTVSEIASRFRLPEAAIIDYNGLDNPNRIFAGQVLRIPPDARVAERRRVTRPSYRPAYRERVARRDSARHSRKVYMRRPVQVREAQAYVAPLHFMWPVSGRVISSFGAMPSGGRNDGINIAARLGEPIRAAADGTVIYAGDELKGYGNLILIRHEDGYVTAYAHAERLAVVRGAHVKKGAVIGYAGSTGDVSRPQLHFEIRHRARPVDPKPLLLASAGA